MKLLVITYPHEIENEVEKITQLFAEGLEVLHFRKPDWDFEKYEGLLKQIPSQHYKKVVIHSHFKLIEKYNLRGVHFKSQYLRDLQDDKVKEVFRLATKRNVTISASMHSFDEVRNNKWKFNYVFLSPLFDSISKVGYVSEFNPEEIKAFLKVYKSPIQLVALGGISEKNIQTVKQYGFSGAALLGAIWNEGQSIESFRTIKKLMSV